MIKQYNYYGNNYGVDEFGNVYGLKGNPMTIKFSQDGYPQVQLRGTIKNTNGKIKRTFVKVHTMVAKCFVEKPHSEIKLEVNHKDFDRKNNYYKNLEWVTHSENINHSRKNGRYIGSMTGIKNANSKLQESDIFFIRDLYDNKKMKIRQIYRQFYQNKVTETMIENICKRRNWTNL